MKQKVLLIGSGGREHALAWKIAQSPLLNHLYCAPGNAGIADVAQCVSLNIENHDEIIEFCRENEITFVVVGPEAPLVAGIVDDLQRAGIDAFGPTQAAAQLEGSKSFTHEICDQFNIPAARYATFNNAPKAKQYIRGHSMPVVIKADGLAAGKGVVIANDVSEAIDAVEACFEGEFGAAGTSVVIEEFLSGEEVSLFAICDGHSASLIGTAQDHKRAYDGDEGPNTGGMGAYSPAPVLTQDLIDNVMSNIIVPTLAGMHAKSMPITGILFAGLMLTPSGPKLIEYNVRFGDPETQPIMMRLDSDLLELMLAASNGTLLEHEITWNNKTALSVVMATKNYPGAYQKGSRIDLHEADNQSDDTIVFHAGTAREDGNLVAIGGRVLNVTASANSVRQAQQKAYERIDTIEWAQGFCRRDIGWRAIERENNA